MLDRRRPLRLLLPVVLRSSLEAESSCLSVMIASDLGYTRQKSSDKSIALQRFDVSCLLRSRAPDQAQV